MSGLEADTIGGYNSLIEKQKKEAMFSSLDGILYVVSQWFYQKVRTAALMVQLPNRTESAGDPETLDGTILPPEETAENRPNHRSGWKEYFFPASDPGSDGEQKAAEAGSESSGSEILSGSSPCPFPVEL